LNFTQNEEVFYFGKLLPLILVYPADVLYNKEKVIYRRMDYGIDKLSRNEGNGQLCH
jgi:hypothetical protein